MDDYRSLAPLYHWFLDDVRIRLGCDTPGVRLALRAIPDGARILDAACGIGVDATALARRGANVTACDASAAMVDQARRRLGSDPDVRVCEWRRLPEEFGPAAFDAVACIGSSIGHATDLTGALTSFRAVLSPGGLLIIDTRDWEATVSPDPVVDVEPVVVERGGRRCRRRYEWSQPTVPGPAELTATLEFLAPDDSVEEERSWVVRQHAFTRRMMRTALADAGFGSIALDHTPGDDRYTATARA